VIPYSLPLASSRSGSISEENLFMNYKLKQDI